MDQNCVVDSIEHFKRVLGDKSASRDARIEALKFIVHFVGDIHHPRGETKADGGWGRWPPAKSRSQSRTNDRKLLLQQTRGYSQCLRSCSPSRSVNGEFLCEPRRLAMMRANTSSTWR